MANNEALKVEIFDRKMKCDQKIKVGPKLVNVILAETSKFWGKKCTFDQKSKILDEKFNLSQKFEILGEKIYFSLKISGF